jgi:glucosamine--fructose-6-phosphate aminotransferase (isomerizing)
MMDGRDSETQQVTQSHKESINRLVAELEAQIEQVITPDLVDRTRMLYTLGCGDSYFAARATRLFFDRYVGLPIEPIESMEFSRYVVDHMPESSLVVAISYGGKVSRTIEAIIQARRRGAYTIAATGFAERSAARESDVALVGSLPGIRQAADGLDAALAAKKLSREQVLRELATPGASQRLAEALGMKSGLHLALVGMGAFLSSLLSLYLIGLRFAVLRARLSSREAGQLKGEMLAATDVQVRTIERNLAKARELAESFKHLNHFLFLGSGPSYAAACFSAAKLFEQPHLNGVPQYLEEWAHLQLFYTRPGGPPIFVIAPPGASRDRAIEQMIGMKKLGATVIAVCEADDAETAGLADHVMPVDGHAAEEFTPIVTIVPGQLFAFASLEIRGQPPIPPPYSFQGMMEVNYNLIYASAIRRD